MKACALVCTRNGQSRIAAAITALEAQEGLSPMEFEILVIDNGSDDDTARFTNTLLENSPFPSRLMVERRPGKMSALNRGVEATEADIVVIVDDDNVIEKTFVRTTLDLYATHPNVGMIGSHNTALFPDGVIPPKWFPALSGRYACAKPFYPEGTRQLNSLAIIAGAGSSFRRKAWRDAVQCGYRFINDTTRHGRFWITGEDTELCYLLSSLGWTFFDDSRLRLTHLMSRERIQWAYARRLARTVGTGCVGIEPFIIFRNRTEGIMAEIRTHWQWQALTKLRRLALHHFKLLKLIFDDSSGDMDIIYIEHDLGSLMRILYERGAYTEHLKRTRSFLRQYSRSTIRG